MIAKQRLLALTAAAGVIGLAGASIPFLGSFQPSERAKASAELLVDIRALEVGVPRRIVVPGGASLYVLKPSGTQLSGLRQLKAHVWDPQVTSYIEPLNVFVMFGLSTAKWGGCHLDHIPISSPRPSRDDRSWLGGYFDPWCEGSFDYAGRAIKTRRYTYNGYNTEAPNLSVPVYEVTGRSQLLLRMRGS